MRQLTARDIMNRQVFTVPESWALQELVTFLAEKGISGAPVLNEDGRLTGFVSLRDVAEYLVSDEREIPPPGWDDVVGPEELSGLPVEEKSALVRDVMTPVAYTVAEEVTIKELAKTMIAGRIHRVLVARGSRIVGIVSTLDLLRLLAEG